MPTPTSEQIETIKTRAQRFDCWPHDVKLDHEAGIIPGWIVVTIGEQKGRPKQFVVTEAGKPMAWHA